MNDYRQRTICGIMIIFMNTKRPRYMDISLKAIIRMLDDIYAEDTIHVLHTPDSRSENRHERICRTMDLTQSIKAISSIFRDSERLNR